METLTLGPRLVDKDISGMIIIESKWNISLPCYNTAFNRVHNSAV